MPEDNAGFSLHPLSWDTAFFGVSSAKAALSHGMSEEQMRGLLKAAEPYRFLSITNPHCDSLNAMLLSKYTSAFVADTNVQFERTFRAEDLRPSDSDTVVGDRYPEDTAVTALAGVAFSASKFVRDPEFARRKGNLVYAEWVKNAFGQPGRYFAVHRDESGRTDGFLLFHFEEERRLVIMELLAVDQSCRGKGVARKLWDAAEREALRIGCNRSQHGTQLQNLEAMNVYAHWRFQITDCSQTFHWWR